MITQHDCAECAMPGMAPLDSNGNCRACGRSILYINHEKVANVKVEAQLTGDMMDILKEENLDNLKQIEQERGEQYGDFDLNMLAAKKGLEGLVSQHLQKEITLPDNIVPMFFAYCKTLRECNQHKDDNMDDAVIYMQQARSMGTNP